jgi:hypothetical protein
MYRSGSIGYADGVVDPEQACDLCTPCPGMVSECRSMVDGVPISQSSPPSPYSADEKDATSSSLAWPVPESVCTRSAASGDGDGMPLAVDPPRRVAWAASGDMPSPPSGNDSALSADEDALAFRFRKDGPVLQCAPALAHLAQRAQLSGPWRRHCSFCAWQRSHALRPAWPVLYQSYQNGAYAVISRSKRFN